MNDPTGILSAIGRWLLKKIIGGNMTIRLFLSKEEKDILKETSEDIYKLSIGQAGEFIRAGKRDFYFEGDSEKTTIYNEALALLIEKELVVYQSGSLFKLTSKGCQISKKLK